MQLLAKQNNVRRGVALMMGCALCVALMNACVHGLDRRYSVFLVLFGRCFFALFPVVGVLLKRKGVTAFRTRRLGGHAARAVVGTASMYCLFAALGRLPMALALAIYLSGPLFVALFSGLFLRERVGARRWAAILAGFVGTLAMLRPGPEMPDFLGALLALAGAVFYALAMIGVRALGRTEPPETTAFYFTLLSTLLAALFLPFAGSEMPTLGGDAWLFVASGVTGGMGQLLMTRASQCAPAAVISPFSYAGLLWTALFGFLFWNERPGGAVLGGGALVVAAGLYLVYCETTGKDRTKSLESQTPGGPVE